MTDDRIFKTKVKEIAELNDLTYTESKRIAIKAKDKIQSRKELLKRFPRFDLNVEEIYKNSENDISYLFNETPDPIKSVKLANEKYIQFDNSSKNTVDISPFVKNDRPQEVDFISQHEVKNVQLSNIAKGRVFISTQEKDVRTLFSYCSDSQFGQENSFFVDRDNYFSQLSKVLKYVESKKENDNMPILIGAIVPDLDIAELRSGKEEVFNDLKKRLNSLLQNEENVYLVTNEKELIESKKDIVEVIMSWREYETPAVVYKHHMRTVVKTILELLSTAEQKRIPEIDWKGSDLDRFFSFVKNDKFNPFDLAYANNRSISSLGEDFHKNYRRFIEELQSAFFNKDGSETENVEIVKQRLKDNEKKVNPIHFENISKNYRLRYFPYDKIHGGSFHQYTNKKVIGFSDGIPQYFNSNVAFIDSRNDDNFLKNICKVNEIDLMTLSNWNELRTDLSEFSALRQSAPLFFKIDYENIEEKDSNYIIEILKHTLYKSLNDQSNKLQIVIESSQAEMIYSLLMEDLDENLKNRVQILHAMDEFLFDDFHGRIDLYDAD